MLKIFIVIRFAVVQGVLISTLVTLQLFENRILLTQTYKEEEYIH